MKQDIQPPKKQIISYYLISLIVILLLNALVFPMLFQPQVKEVADRITVSNDQHAIAKIIEELDYSCHLKGDCQWIGS